MVLSKISCKGEAAGAEQQPSPEQRHGLVTVMFPTRGKVLGFRGVKKIPFRGHEMWEPLGCL